MNEIKRYGSAALFALAVTLGLFVVMGHLLSQSHQLPSGQSTNVNFDFVKAFTEPVTPPKIKRELPEMEKTSEPPAMPTIAMDIPKDGRGPSLTTGIKTDKNWFEASELNRLPKPHLGQGMHGAGGTLKVGIAPMYPPALLQRKVEGWVEVLITVNEVGGVADIEILANKPNRAFDKAAIKAVRKWTFHPRVVDGKAVPFKVRQKIEFNINAQ